MVGVAGYRWAQEVSLSACELLDTGCFRYFAALPGVTRLVISDRMPESYDPKWGTEREQAIKELQKGMKEGRTIEEQAFELEQENDQWDASEDKWAGGNGASGLLTRAAAELSGDSRWDNPPCYPGISGWRRHLQAAMAVGGLVRILPPEHLVLQMMM